MIQIADDNPVGIEGWENGGESSATDEVTADRIPQSLPDPTLRPGWIEVDLERLKRNFELIVRDKPNGVGLLSVVKDEAYSHGAFRVAKTALAAGATFLGLSTLQEAIALRERGIKAPMLMLGDRHEGELPWCIAHDLTCCLTDTRSAEQLGRLAERAGKRVPVHIKVNTGMNRYGIRWSEAPALAAAIARNKSLVLEGVLSHFAQSDETDKTFALAQLARFNEVLCAISSLGLSLKFKHICNSGGFFLLPPATLAIVPLGVMPPGGFTTSLCLPNPPRATASAVEAPLIRLPTITPAATG